jgi:hypothetical protein
MMRWPSTRELPVVVGGVIVNQTVESLIGCLQTCKSWGNAGLTKVYALCRYIQVTAVVPQEGPTTGNARVQVRGANFQNGATVQFGPNAGGNVAFVSATALDVDVPNHAEGWVSVTVTNPNGDAATLGQAYLHLGPVINRIQPNDGPTVGNTVVVITGLRFLPNAQVTIGGAAAANVAWVDAQTLNVTTAPGEADSVAVAVEVTNGDGFNSSDWWPSGFRYLAPSVTLVTPAHGPSPGNTPIVITGQRFINGATADIGGVAQPVVFGNAQTLNATTQPGAVGPQTVAVTIPDLFNSRGMLLAGFTYHGPEPAQIAPALGPSAGDTNVTITGDYFVHPAQVHIGGAAARNVQVVNLQTIQCTTQPGPARLCDVVVTGPDGATGTLQNGYTYHPPRVDSLVPTDGPSAGGTDITITGDYFVAPLQVHVGGVAAQNVQVTNLQTITATTQAGPVGLGDVVVTGPDGLTGTRPNGYTYRAPRVDSIQPVRGPVIGTTPVVISGDYFVHPVQVQICGVVPQNIVVTNRQTINATTQPGLAGVGDVVVIGPDAQRGTLPNGYTYVPPPAIHAINPAAGGTSGGTPVTIQGQDFQVGLNVTFGGTAAVIAAVTANTINLTTPAHPRGRVDVVVTNPDLQADTSVDGFEYRPPVVTAINPATCIFAGNIPATITGDYFGAAVDVDVGVNAAVVLNRVSEQQVDITVPAHALAHAYAGLQVFVTNTHDNLRGSRTLFSYEPFRVNNIQPSLISHAGNQQITITGTGFDPGVTMTIAGQNAVVAYVNSNQFTATTPALASPANVSVDVVINNNDGQAADTQVDGIYYTAPPALVAVTPARGPNRGGNTIYLHGMGFNNPSVVRFGGVQSPMVAFESATRLRVTVPVPVGQNNAAATVNVQVTDNHGTVATLANSYVYSAVPGRRNAVIYPAGQDFNSIAAAANNDPSVFLALRALHNDGELNDRNITAANQVLNFAYHAHLLNGAGGLLFVRLQDNPRVHQIIDVTLGRGGQTGNNYACNLIGPVNGYGFWHAEGNWQAPRPQQHVNAMRGNFADANAIQNASVNAFGLTTVEPAEAPVAGLWTVTIRGTGIPAAVTVAFGGVASAAVAWVDANTVTALVPAGAGPGAVAIRVEEVGTQVRADLPNAFTYQLLVLNSVTRAIGTDAGNDTIILVGTGFAPNATVTVGGLAALNVEVHSATCITCETPAHPQGNVLVVVTSNGANVQIAFDYL